MYQSTQEPLISICVPCYNHEKYIPYFMETLLKQDFKDWELIVTDDCSTDNSYSLLKSYSSDRRIRIYKNDCNRHLCQTMNNSFSLARGKYICIMYTDDAFVDGKLKNDFDYLEQHKNISVLYNDLIPIGEDNSILDEQWKLPIDFSKNKLLHKLFLEGNCLFIPGLFFRKDCLDKLGYHNPLLCLTQDYEYHIKLLLNYDIAKSEHPLVYYRRRENEQNLSAATNENTNFIYNEMALMLGECLKCIKDINLFRDIFPEFNKYSNLVKEDICFYTSLVLVDSPNPAIRIAALKVLYDFVLNHAEYLEKTYNFFAKDFMSISKNINVFNLYDKQIINLKQIKSVSDNLIWKIYKSMYRKLKRRKILKD